jgi:hypothetical protein
MIAHRQNAVFLKIKIEIIIYLIIYLFLFMVNNETQNQPEKNTFIVLNLIEDPLHLIAS